MKTPQKNIEWALCVEDMVKETSLYSRYMEFMNNKAMSERTSDDEIRAGCILTGLFYRTDIAQN